MIKPISIASVLLACALPVAATAQNEYPTKPVRIILGQSPGGATDVVARLLGQQLGRQFGQNVLVENRTGAAGSIAASYVANSTPDGYTLLVVSSSYAINPSLYTNLPFDPVKDFAPVSLIAEAPFLLVVHPSLPVHSVKELVALAKAHPGELNFASGGIGSSGQLAGELFKYLADVNIVHVPYKGAGPGLIDVMAGNVDMTFGSVLSTLGHVKNGRLRALAVTSAKRSKALPDLPTVAEAGVKGYHRTTWYALLAPANTPAAIVDRISAETKKAVGSAAVHKKILTDGAEPVGSAPAEFESFLAAQMKQAAEIIKRAGVKK
jgi:tripartite-type tricarboxylate transporter receptor subunit TctC